MNYLVLMPTAAGTPPRELAKGKVFRALDLEGWGVDTLKLVQAGNLEEQEPAPTPTPKPEPTPVPDHPVDVTEHEAVVH
jgi:hypothetical protein